MTEMTQQLAQASMLGGMQATLQNVERTAGETLAIVRGQEARINKVEANDGVQNTRLDAHDREFVGLRTELAGSRLTWPKLLAGFSWAASASAEARSCSPSRTTSACSTVSRRCCSRSG